MNNNNDLYYIVIKNENIKNNDSFYIILKNENK